MRYIGSFILLLCFLCLRANAQGLEFNTYESETIQKTSYSVFDENPLTFKGHFSISYDLAIQDYGSFGYIFRLKDLKRENADIYSFVFSYDAMTFQKNGNSYKLTRTHFIIRMKWLLPPDESLARREKRRE